MIVEYREFQIPKRKGGFRKIEQPIGEGMEYLRQTLRQLENTKELKPSYFAHAFMNGRNIVTCAKQHQGKKFIARIDIEDFFGSITFDKFKEYILKQIKDDVSEERKQELIELVKPCFKYDKKKEMYTYLPQGAPTSPFLSNVYMRFFDWKVAWFCAGKGVVYNRYADDMFFSGENGDNIYVCMSVARKYLKHLVGLEENKKKRKFMKQGQQMNVVGVVLNEKFQIPKRTRKIIRAMLHNAQKEGKELTCEQKGLISFKNMVDTYADFKFDNIEICKRIHIAYNI